MKCLFYFHLFLQHNSFSNEKIFLFHYFHETRQVTIRGGVRTKTALKILSYLFNRLTVLKLTSKITLKYFDSFKIWLVHLKYTPDVHSMINVQKQQVTRRQNTSHSVKQQQPLKILSHSTYFSICFSLKKTFSMKFFSCSSMHEFMNVRHLKYI